MGGEGDVILTFIDMKRGVLQEPPMPSLDLTFSNYQGKEIDPIIAQASQKIYR